ncbi:MAG: BlaI/MecI/CopY family transcriptional regulator [Tepidiformaceae bacterium]
MNEHRDVSDTLPELERQAFEAVRALGRANVNDVAEQLSSRRPLAYTTVMTVLTRLWQKGYLLRERDGKSYAYSPRDAAAIAGDLGGRAAKEAIDCFGTAALTGFAQNLSPEQRTILRRLLDDAAQGDALDPGTGG